MKIKHLLEVIERQQDQFSSIGVQFETLTEGVGRKEDELTTMIEKLSSELKINGEDKMPSISDTMATGAKKLTAVSEDDKLNAAAQAEKEKKLEKENQRLAQENQVMMEQLERVTGTAASNSKVDELEEIQAEYEKALKLKEVKSNRLKRLEASAKDKAYSVQNARELALSAYKAKLEEEIKKMSEQVSKALRGASKNGKEDDGSDDRSGE